MILSVEINRINDDERQTLGELHVIGLDFKCKTLELPYRDNQREISCIPCGTYIVNKRWSPKYGFHFEVKDVPNRDYILIHSANFARQLRGCIAVGEAHVDIDQDGSKDVSNSKKTLQKLIEILPNEFKLKINGI
jgi:hypothetical protein